MNEHGMVKIKNTGYDRYEELLWERDALRKEAFLWKNEYTRIFGELMLQLFEKKIACIRKKKTIAFCQASVNRGEFIDRRALQALVNREMEEYNQRLRQMMREKDIADSAQNISRSALQKIKKRYYKLARLIHPDINPKTEEVPELKQLWQMVVIAYRTNSLQELEEAEVLIQRALEKRNLQQTELEIPDLVQKMEAVREEILAIKETTPYQYRYLLEDEQAVQQRKEELIKEQQEYEAYDKELEGIMDGLMTRGVRVTWHSN